MAYLAAQIWPTTSEQQRRAQQSVAHAPAWTDDQAFKAPVQSPPGAGDSGPPAVGDYRVSGRHPDGSRYEGSLNIRMPAANRYELVQDGAAASRRVGGWKDGRIRVVGETVTPHAAAACETLEAQVTITR